MRRGQLPPLRRWQDEALDNFLLEGRGIVKASTGTGKTMVALSAWECIIEYESSATLIVVVPSSPLQRQWYSKLIGAGVEKSDICRHGGGYSGPIAKVNVMVINTARKMLPALEIDNLLLVVDESHRSASDENRKIFNTRYEWLLGLTATPGDETEFFGRVLYDYTFADAIQAGEIRPVSLYNIGYSMDGEEQEEYDQYTTEKMTLETKLGLYGSNPRVINSIISRAREKGDRERERLAERLRQLLFKRKRALYVHNTRLEIAEEIITAHFDRKILVVGEAISAAQYLNEKIIGSVLEHSKLSTNQRKEAIGSFSSDESRVMITVRSLTEGIDIPGIDLVLILSGASGELRFIQSIGRGVRVGGADTTIVYRLFARETTDEDAINNLIEADVLPETSIHITDPNGNPIGISGRPAVVREVDVNARRFIFSSEDDTGTFSFSSPDHGGLIPIEVSFHLPGSLVDRLLDLLPEGGEFFYNLDGSVVVTNREKFHDLGIWELKTDLIEKFIAEEKQRQSKRVMIDDNPFWRL